jgi:hypothetical protein
LSELFIAAMLVAAQTRFLWELLLGEGSLVILGSHLDAFLDLLLEGGIVTIQASDIRLGVRLGQEIGTLPIFVTFAAFEKDGVVMALIAGVDTRRFLMDLVTRIALTLLRIVRVRGLGVYGVGVGVRGLGVYGVGVGVDLLTIHSIVFGEFDELFVTPVLVALKTLFLRELTLLQGGVVLLFHKHNQFIYLLLDGGLVALQTGDVLLRVRLSEKVGGFPRLQIRLHDVADSTELGLFVVVPQSHSCYDDHHYPYPCNHPDASSLQGITP